MEWSDIMKTDRELNYRLYIQRSDGFLRSPFESELGFYRAVQSGDVIEVEKRFDSIKSKFLDGKGTLSLTLCVTSCTIL